MAVMRRGKKGLFTHKRHVPRRFRGVEPRDTIWTALHTDNRTVALDKAHKIELVQDARWEALLSGQHEDAKIHYERLRYLSERRGYSYLPASDVAKLPLPQILERVEAANTGRAADADALLGAADEPSPQLSELFEAYADLTVDRRVGKDRDQLRRWANPHKKAVRNLIEVVGDIPIKELTRQNALRFRSYWWERVEAGEVGANSANKDFTHIRKMLSDVAMMNGWDFENPFKGISFKEEENRRPPFSDDWIRHQILKASALGRMNDEERAILLVLINTGARPSEITHLQPERIKLDTNIPYIEIRPDLRQLKTPHSRRDVPLLGVSLEAMREFPEGFPRYRGRDTWSNSANKYLSENHLLETPKHSAYSLRHSLSDRLLNTGCEDRVRKEIMGHRPETVIYGKGASLAMKANVLAKVAF